MKFGITWKLFVAICAACVLVAASMAVAMRWSFERGFLGYLQQQSRSGGNTLPQTLENAYRLQHGWAFARDPASLVAVIPELSGELRAPLGQPREPMMPPPGWMPPASLPDGANGIAPPAPLVLYPPMHPYPFFEPSPDESGHGGPFGGAYRGSSDAPRRYRFPPFVLYDADGAKVLQLGPPPPADEPRYDLRVDGKLVGWLAVGGPDVMFRSADRRFQAQQVRATWAIVGLATLLAAVVAIIVARLLLGRVRQLVDATQRLASGDYATRVPDYGRDELHVLASNVNRLASSLDNAEQSRRNFIADVSHELRTPLAVLRGELEAIEDGVRKPDPATIGSLQAEVALLNQLIDDLYELSLADIGQLSFEKVPVDLACVAHAAAESFRDRFAAKGIVLDADGARDLPEAVQATMMGDPHRLTQLIKNLLENALRYTDAPGRVRVAVSRRGARVRLDIEDSPPAVPDELLSQVFERFFRVDPSRSRVSGGAGLGLALCRHIVEQHDGRIAAARAPLGGLWIQAEFDALA